MIPLSTSADAASDSASQALHARGAPLWRRFAALIYDLLILAALSMLYGGLAVGLYVAVTGDRGEAYTPMFEGVGFQLGWVAVIASFYCFFWRKGGQTLGMRAWRLQLQDVAGGRISWRQGLIRCAAGAFALGLAGAGFWWAGFDPKRDCAHDRISRTRVVLLPKQTSR